MGKSIVFASPPLSLRERYGVSRKSGGETMPLGLASLAAVTRAEGHATRIVDSEVLGLTPEQACEAILRHDPDVVGFTAVTVSVHNAAQVAALIKQRRPQVVTLIGGHHFTAVPKETMQLFDSFDIGVLGEAEVTIVELLDALGGNRQLRDVKGLILRDGNGFLLTGPRERISDLDTLPLPAWDLLPSIAEHYCPPVHTVKRLPATNLVTSRGCPSQCIFCDRTVYGNRGTALSAGRVVEMIRDLHDNYGIREIQFRDDNFTVFRKRLIELCRLLKESDLKIVWSCAGRVDMVTPEILAMMKEAGCWQIWYGVESGSQKVLDTIKKGTTIEGIRKAVLWTKQAGINPCGFFIIGHPGDTHETIQETIRFALSLPLAETHATFMTPFPGSELYTSHEKYGEFIDRDWRRLNAWRPVFIPRGLTKDDLLRYSNEFHRRFFLRPKVILSYASKIRSWKHLWVYFQGFLSFLTFIRKRSDQEQYR